MKTNLNNLLLEPIFITTVILFDTLAHTITTITTIYYCGNYLLYCIYNNLKKLIRRMDRQNFQHMHREIEMSTPYIVVQFEL